MNLKQMPGTIIGTKDLSPTAREVIISLPEPLDFTAGAFVNIFAYKDGKRERRAYSISSSEASQSEITLTIRKGNSHGMSALFWGSDVTDMPISVMGPLGLNTVDCIEHNRVVLIAFGIGVSVIKAIAEHLATKEEIENVVILTGSRSEEEILYKEFFDNLVDHDPRFSVRYVLSRPINEDYPLKGYVKDYLYDIDFTESTVYLCGQKSACESTRDVILSQSTTEPQFLIEAFD